MDKIAINKITVVTETDAKEYEKKIFELQKDKHYIRNTHIAVVDGVIYYIAIMEEFTFDY